MDLKKNNCKIGIIGSGNAGIISAIMTIFSYRFHNLDEPSITIFHDSNVPTEIVGQGTTLNVSQAISRIVENEVLGNQAGITPKVGFLYKNWARNNKNLLYKFDGNGMAYHFDPKKLRECFLNKDLATFIERSVTPEEIKNDFDLIIDCRGKSVNNWDDYEEMVSPLNCALIGRTTESRPPEVWTENIATPDGWTFKIPLEDGYSYGYVFNENITDPDTAEKNFYEMFGIETLHKVPFKNYLCKNYFDEENKTLLNGNRLFFYEPLESTATPMYGSLVQEFIVNNILIGPHTIPYTLSRYDVKLREIHEWILWHYYYGSDYDTEFWRYAKNLSQNYNYSEHFLKLVDRVKESDLKKNVGQFSFPSDIAFTTELNFHDYACWYSSNN